VELIQLLRQQGDLDKARHARHNMSELFPLTEGHYIPTSLPPSLLSLPSLPLSCLLFLHTLVDLDGNSSYVISVELWLEWLGDELPLASLPEASAELRALFEQAVGDYLCTSVFLCSLLSSLLYMEYFAVDKVMLYY